MNDFIRDNEWQREQRDRILSPWYGRYATDGRYVYIDKGSLATILQKRFAVDTIVQGDDGQAVCIEEKIVRWTGREYKCMCLETDSCTRPGHESPGWMHYGMADYLFYCFQQQNFDLVCYLVDFQALKDWFWKWHDNYNVFGPLNTLNGTVGRLVPIEDVRCAAPTWKVLAQHPDNVQEAS